MPHRAGQKGADAGLAHQALPGFDKQLLVRRTVQNKQALDAVGHGQPIDLGHTQHTQHIQQAFRRLLGTQQGTAGVLHQDRAKGRITADQATQLHQGHLGVAESTANIQGDGRQAG